MLQSALTMLDTSTLFHFDLTDGLLALYVLFNSISVKSGRLGLKMKGVCNRTQFTIEKIPPPGTDLGTAKSAGQCLTDGAIRARHFDQT